MKRKQWKRLVLLTVFLSCLVVFCDISASANTGWYVWEGTNFMGAYVGEEECPLVVEKEVLTINIPEFPKSEWKAEDDGEEYGSHVVAEYTIYNPTEDAITVTLYFPLGKEPSYMGTYGEDGETFLKYDDTKKYDVLVDGEAVNKRLRYSYPVNWESFEFKTELARLSDEYVKNGFFTPDLKMTKYVFEISGVDKETYSNAKVVLEVSQEYSDNERMLLIDGLDFEIMEDGTEYIIENAINGNEVSFYILGEPLEEMPEWIFYEGGDIDEENKLSAEEKIAGTMNLLHTEESTLEQWILSNRYGASGISNVDWYNAVLFDLREIVTKMEQSFLTTASFRVMNYDLLTRWYEYEITLEPGERIVNTIVAPLYPYIEGNYEPTIFRYIYLLSPAKTWAEFGSLEMIVNTPYYIVESSVGTFQTTENGYQLYLDKLTEEKLEICLCSKKDPKEVAMHSRYGVLGEPMTWILLGSLITIIGVSIPVIKKLKRTIWR